MTERCTKQNCEDCVHCPKCNSNLVDFIPFVDDAYCRSCKTEFKL